MYIAVFRKKVIAASEHFNEMYTEAKKISEHFVTSQVSGDSRITIQVS